MTTKINATDTTAAALPRNIPFTVLTKGADLYLAQLRNGATVTVVTADGEVEAKISATPGIGPLANHFNPMSYGQAQHYATKGGSEPMALFDSLEALNPKDKAALDPRTVYSQAQLLITVPLTAPVAPTPLV